MLDGLHNRLWAEARRSVVLVLQGMDAAGKDGTIRRVLTGLNPQGCSVVNFKAPTDGRPRPRLPLAHPRRDPGAGDPRGVEPVALRGRRRRPHASGRSTTSSADRRYRHIREFERMLCDEGITVVKVFLHISKDEQRARLQARIDDPAKNWKFRRADLDARAQWDEYQELLRGGDHRDLDRLGAVVRRAGRPQVGPRRRGGRRCWSTCSSALDPQIPDPEPGLEGSDRRVVRPDFGSDWSPRRSIDQNGYSMDVESRDSVSLKPAELDELGQLVSGMGLPLQDEQLDGHVEQFPLVAVAEVDGEIQGFLFGSLERIGGTPCILWGLGGRETGQERPSQPRRAGRRALPPGRHLLPRRGRPRRRAGGAPGGVHAVLGARRRVSRARSTRPTARSGPGAGASPAGSAATPATTTARFRLSAHGQPGAGAARGGGEGRGQGRGRAGRRGRPGQRRGDDRLRLGDGRGPRRRPRHPPQLTRRTGVRGGGDRRRHRRDGDDRVELRRAARRGR